MMQRQRGLRLAFIFAIIVSAGTINTKAFQFPKVKFVGLSHADKYDGNEPKERIKKGSEETASLRRSLEKHCKFDVLIHWEPQVTESYEVAEVIFREVANSDKSECAISFPCMRRPADLENLSSVLQSNKFKQILRFGLVECELYPSSPAPYIYIKFDRSFNGDDGTDEHSYLSESAASSTLAWLNNFLGKYHLCPYTSSASRAAIGLSSVGVPVGKVHIQVAEPTNIRSDNAHKAARLVSAFWTEVVTLMKSSQDEWATSLVVFAEYDDDFLSFAQVCDDLIESTVVATQATEFIGKAWFHPQYDADKVGHTDVVAGHAVPHKMVEGFMNSLNVEELAYDELARANNLVRKTPHATINILRRSQLKAAAEYEKGLGTRRPKPNSIYVRNVIRLSNEITSI